MPAVKWSQGVFVGEVAQDATKRGTQMWSAGLQSLLNAVPDANGNIASVITNSALVPSGGTIRALGLGITAKGETVSIVGPTTTYAGALNAGATPLAAVWGPDGLTLFTWDSAHLRRQTWSGSAFASPVSCGNSGATAISNSGAPWRAIAHLGRILFIECRSGQNRTRLWISSATDPYDFTWAANPLPESAQFYEWRAFEVYDAKVIGERIWLATNAGLVTIEPSDPMSGYIPGGVTNRSRQARRLDDAVFVGGSVVWRETMGTFHKFFVSDVYDWNPRLVYAVSSTPAPTLSAGHDFAILSPATQGGFSAKVVYESGAIATVRLVSNATMTAFGHFAVSTTGTETLNVTGYQHNSGFTGALHADAQIITNPIIIPEVGVQLNEVYRFTEIVLDVLHMARPAAATPPDTDWAVRVYALDENDQADLLAEYYENWTNRLVHFLVNSGNRTQLRLRIDIKAGAQFILKGVAALVDAGVV